MHGSHTGEYLIETFLNMLEDWKISKDRVALVLRDSGANIVKGMRLTELPDLSCTAHTLQLVVNDSLASQRAVTDVITISKKCATHLHHSILEFARHPDGTWPARAQHNPGRSNEVELNAPHAAKNAGAKACAYHLLW